MSVIVDSSMTLAWILPDESSSAADAVLDRIRAENRAMLAPELWITETANALVSAHRRGRLTESAATRVVEVLGRLPVEIDKRSIDRAALVATALRSGLSAYDSTYLLLAARTGSALATLDRRLSDAAGAIGVEVWGA
ncbi:type II toxin-antitoxin system VapC family toxin [uncultured Microbacterium sp.]|jgi:predicted nucleic acid-binding protein|uniref:type II toxin-antitoxin system VapC family toxin n=1 Tax=uncultured Microbacterium sp. TaxID=191216 RepID=UPI0025CDB3E5|nr:type II toxin-antitoxin system VapC family toxin [uncultured Microbacterium sp.]